jgi:hypothetical protein
MKASNAVLSEALLKSRIGNLRHAARRVEWGSVLVGLALWLLPKLLKKSRAKSPSA